MFSKKSRLLMTLMCSYNCIIRRCRTGIKEDGDSRCVGRNPDPGSHPQSAYFNV